MAVQVLTPASVSTGLALLGGHLVTRAAVALVVGNQGLTTAQQVLVNVGPAATWTLPAPATAVGHIFYLTNHGSGTITFSVAVRTSNTGNQTTLPNAAASNTITIVSDGVVWRRIAR